MWHSLCGERARVGCDGKSLSRREESYRSVCRRGLEGEGKCGADLCRSGRWKELGEACAGAEKSSGRGKVMWAASLMTGCRELVGVKKRELEKQQ